MGSGADKLLHYQQQLRRTRWDVAKGARMTELFTDANGDLPEYHGQLMQLAEMIDRVERSMSHSLQFFAHRCGLPFIDSQVLASAFDLGENARPSVIAEHVRVPLSTMTGVIARLERNGLVVRERANDDGRAYILSVTEKGETVLKEMLQPMFEEIHKVITEAGDDALHSITVAFEQVCTLTEMLERRVQEQARD
ncbi:MAG: winged helix DNA-binding protein [Thermomicrobiales bacterium]|nr:winged helix DNA-binding protein [Thermomicrobiales bacterium]